jgi:hypothetical protein
MKIFLILALSFFLFRAVMAQADHPDHSFAGAKQTDTLPSLRALR